MKKILTILLAAVLVFTITACEKKRTENNGPQNDSPADNTDNNTNTVPEKDTLNVAEPTEDTTQPITMPSGQEVSPRTILITVADDFGEEDLQALLKKYSLSVKYDYSSMKIYALTADHDMNEKELTALLEALAKENKILSAEPDQMIRLTDPVQPTLSTY